MFVYKNFSGETLDVLYQVVANQNGITVAEAEVLVTPYLQGQIDRVDLLADIDGQLEIIPELIDNIDTALAAVPNLAIPTGAKLIFTLLLENQKRILRIERRELKAWKFVITNVKIE